VSARASTSRRRAGSPTCQTAPYTKARSAADYFQTIITDTEHALDHRADNRSQRNSTQVPAFAKRNSGWLARQSPLGAGAMSGRIAIPIRLFAGRPRRFLPR